MYVCICVCVCPVADHRSTVGAEISKASIDELAEQLSDTQRALRAAQDGIVAHKRSMEDAKKQLKIAQTSREAKEQELKDVIEELGGEQEFLTVVFPKVLRLCQEATKHEILQRMGQLRVEIDSSIENPMLMGRHATATAELDQLTGELLQVNARLDNAETSLAARMHTWMNSVRSLAEKLNHYFMTYMQELGYDGRVVLRDTESIDKYQLQIQVSYRSKEVVSDLDKFRNSGGERAVATVMYLMALQEMTTAPFRVVDEINQG